MCSTIVGENGYQEIDLAFEFFTANYNLNEYIWPMVEGPLNRFILASASTSVSQVVDVPNDGTNAPRMNGKLE